MAMLDLATRGKLRSLDCIYVHQQLGSHRFGRGDCSSAFPGEYARDAESGQFELQMEKVCPQPQQEDCQMLAKDI